MRIIQIDVNKPIKVDIPLCACIGYFDGLHKGHKELIDKTIELSKKFNCEPALITFDPDPWVTIKNLTSVKHITTMKQRINLIVKFGIRTIIILKFTKEMSDLTHEEFSNKILGSLNIKAIVCGFDFRYGQNGQGDIETLKNTSNFEVHVIDSVNEDGQKISSTRISNELKHGSIEKVNSLLGYNYEIQGIVIHGRNKGSTIGFPTANIEVEQEYYIPRQGVYACFIKVENKWHQAMVNIGFNPTFNSVDKVSVEAHILDFNKDIYGKRVTLEFVKFLREEQKFNNIDNLKLQLDQDIFSTRKALTNLK